MKCNRYIIYEKKKITRAYLYPNENINKMPYIEHSLSFFNTEDMIKALNKSQGGLI